MTSFTYLPSIHPFWHNLSSTRAQRGPKYLEMVSRSIRSKFLSSSSSLSSASTSSTASAATTVTPSFSYDGMRFDLPSLAEETGSDLLSPITGEDEDENDSDWLLDAETCMRQDLVTSQREFELAKEILDALKLELVEAKMEKKPGPHSLKLEDQVFLLSACQEYSGSRCHMLEERLRQIQMWSDEGQMGHDIPTGVPDEYALASFPLFPAKLF